jgi:hypothetical protein
MTSRLCRSHKYILLSSLPDTIHFPPVTLKQAPMQYLAFWWPTYVFRQRDVWKSQRRMALSWAVESMYFELGENCTCWLWRLFLKKKNY